jgi:integrase
MATAEKRSGSYSTRVWVTDSLTGRRYQKRITARTKRALDTDVARVKAKSADGTYREPNETRLADYMDTWLGTLTGKDSTRLARSVVIRNHIATDPIGSIPLGRLKRSHIQDLVDRKARDCAPNTVKGIYSTLRRALRRAVIVGSIPANPCDSIELPARSTQRPSVFDEDDTRRFVAGVADDDLAALWTLAITIGLRRGELLALKWTDIDLGRGTLTVARTLTRTADCRWVIGDSAKSDSSYRTIQLPAICVDALRAHRVRQLERRLTLGAAWQDSGAVFDRGDGAHLISPNVLANRFAKIITALDLPRLTLHSLRHTAATNALRRTVPVHVVSQMLGHSSPAITLNVYAHVLSDMQHDAASRIDSIFTTERSENVTIL